MKPKFQFNILLFLFFCVAGTPVMAQGKIKINAGCTFSGTEKGKEFNVEPPGDEAKSILQKMLDEMGIPSVSFTLLESPDIKTAMAAESNSQKYILYNRKFLLDFKKDSLTRNAAYAVLAHEVAHHILGHKLDLSDLATAKENELHADYFAGGVLFSLCRTLDEARSALRPLPSQATNTHPPKSVREKSVSDGWKNRQKLKGKNPCEVYAPFQPTPKSKISGNRSQNLRGKINDEHIILTYDVLALRNKSFKSYLTIDDNTNIIPKSIEWKGDPTLPGINKEIIWHYTRDGYTRQMVEKSDLISIAAVDPNVVNKKTKPIVWAGLIAGIVVGGGAAGIGISKEIKAADLYDVYKNNTDPEAPVYTDAENPLYNGLSRSEYYAEANPKHITAQWLGYTGGIVFGFCGTVLVTKLLKKKPNVFFYCLDGYPASGDRSGWAVLPQGAGVGLRIVLGK